MWPFANGSGDVAMQKGCAILGQCSAKEAQRKIYEFSKRYTHYQFHEQKSVWTFNTVSEHDGALVVQLIDKTFEPPRGNVSSDQPYICINFTQAGDDVKLTYWLKWKKWKWPLVISGMICSFAIASRLLLISALGSKDFVVGLGLMLFAASLFTAWLIRNIRHDRLAMKVFEELLCKNFDNIQLN